MELFQVWLACCFGLAHGHQAVLAASSSTTRAPPLKLTIQSATTQIHQSVLSTAVSNVMNSGLIPHSLDDASSQRLLYVDNLREPNEKNERNSFRAVVADYENDRTFYINVGDGLGPASDATIEITNDQPMPSAEELKDAAAIAGFGPGAHVQVSMPVIIHQFNPDGSTPRILSIRAGDNGTVLQNFQVNMSNRSATSVKPAVQAAEPTCTGRHEKEGIVETTPHPGTAHVTITDSQNQVLWELEVTRPAGSHGSMGSGVELANVHYKKKMVLKQAHVPILNVNYLQNVDGCGPTYRDWMYEEFPFQCNNPAGDAIPGFRECTVGRSKIFNDVGDLTDLEGWRGVAFDVSDHGVRIRSQLRADWYRYVSEWDLMADGSIIPRWYFGGVLQAHKHCLCVHHHHHAHWRFDFDIESSRHNVLHECTGSLCTEQKFTKQMTRTSDDNQHWDIINTDTHRGYSLKPGKHDRKVSDPGDSSGYGVGDLWLVKADAPVDDGCKRIVGSWPANTANGDCTQANFGKIMPKPGESTYGQDLVLWYAASFMHNEAHDNPNIPHVLEPTLTPIGQW